MGRVYTIQFGINHSPIKQFLENTHFLTSNTVPHTFLSSSAQIQSAAVNGAECHFISRKENNTLLG